MLIVPPQKVLKKQSTIRPPRVAPMPPGVPLICDDGDFDFDSLILVLIFRGAIDLSGFRPSQITVSDGVSHHMVYSGSGVAGQQDINSVEISMVPMRAYGGDSLLLNATIFTGIKAVDDGGLWPGASDVSLPFGG